MRYLIVLLLLTGCGNGKEVAEMLKDFRTNQCRGPVKMIITYQPTLFGSGSIAMECELK